MTTHRTGVLYFLRALPERIYFDNPDLAKEEEKHLGHMIKITHALIHMNDTTPLYTADQMDVLRNRIES